MEMYQPPAEVGESVSRTIARRRRSQREWLGSWPVVVATSTSQLFICAVIVFGDVGFDHPGRFGLDFEHFLLLAGLQICLMLLSVVLAIWQRRGAFLAVPVIIVLLAVAAYMRA